MASAKTLFPGLAANPNGYSLPQPMFNYVNASYTILSSGIFRSSDVPSMSTGVIAQVPAGSLQGFTYVGISMARLPNNIWYAIIIFGS
jgi:hypothetical protein